MLEQRIVGGLRAEALEHLHEVVAVRDQEIDLLPVEPGEVAEAEQAIIEQCAHEHALHDVSEAIERCVVLDLAPIGAGDLERGDVDIRPLTGLEALRQAAGRAQRHAVQ